MEFAGFSQDSRQFGYSHLACPGGRLGEGRTSYHLQQLKPGKRKLHFERVEGPPEQSGGRLPGYFRRERFRVVELQGERLDGHRWRFDARHSVTVEVEMVTEKRVAWYFSVSHGDRQIFRYRGEFEEIYFGMVPRLFLSPDGQKAAVVLALDAMIKVDAGFAVFSLNP